ncbi:MAG TPA: outer membrane beta-barrel protein [Allosphingosinicella sp.]|nr:outer membrane beta-barrel protein [Allosphingosinicella sp.]
MKTSAFAVLLAATASVAATPAAAQEEGPNFTGVRFEARAGWDSFGGRIAMTDPDDTDETITVSSSRDKLGYGAELGYDVQLGPIVVGAYAGVDNSSSATCLEIAGDDLGCLESGRNLYAGARAGVVVAGNLLVYGRGGYSRGRYSLAYDDDVDAGASPVWVIADTAGGYHYGGGLEMAFTPNLYGRVEYVRTRYDRLETVNPVDDDLAVGIRTRRNQVTAGLGLRF